MYESIHNNIVTYCIVSLSICYNTKCNTYCINLDKWYFLCVITLNLFLHTINRSGCLKTNTDKQNNETYEYKHNSVIHIINNT